jgi:hypothetical protein
VRRADLPQLAVNTHARLLKNMGLFMEFFWELNVYQNVDPVVGGGMTRFLDNLDIIKHYDKIYRTLI